MADDKKTKAPKAAAPAAAGKDSAKVAKPKAEKAAKGSGAKAAPLPEGYSPRMRKMYDEVVRAKLIEQFGYKNPLEVPRIDKIVLNMGVGDAVNDTKPVTTAAGDLALIAGQKPIVTRARKAISTFKVRENMPIGAKVTLRKTRMYEFLDRLVTIALPRVRDFRGVSGRAFDGRGNYNFGIKEQIIFPEINFDAIDALRGMDIAITTTAKTDAEAKALLEGFKFPFRN